VNLLLKTKQAELGYAIDSLYYSIPDYTGYVRNGLAKLTVKDVNDAIRRHLRTTDLRIVAVARDTDLLKKKLTGNSISEMSYNSPKPQDVLDEDKIVERFRLDLKPDSIRIVPGDTIFE
jgi:zinc protease